MESSNSHLAGTNDSIAGHGVWHLGPGWSTPKLYYAVYGCLVVRLCVDLRAKEPQHAMKHLCGAEIDLKYSVSNWPT